MLVKGVEYKLKSTKLDDFTVRDYEKISEILVNKEDVINSLVGTEGEINSKLGIKILAEVSEVIFEPALDLYALPMSKLKEVTEAIQFFFTEFTNLHHQEEQHSTDFLKKKKSKKKELKS